ncbi:MAG: type II/IV secretion system protein [Candidatus Aceula meridiana]|nr:type II/IV secretion system protein [Candidatus Aceula meridiana]
MTTLIEALLKEKLITFDNLQDAEAKQIGAQKPIHELLVEMDFLKEEDLLRVASKVFNLPAISLDNEKIDSQALKLVQYDKAKRYGAFPLRVQEGKLVLAMSNPQDVTVLDDLSAIAGMGVTPVLAKKNDIAECIDKYYLVDDSIYDLMKNIVDDTKVELVKEGKEDQSFLDADVLKGDRSPVVKLANLILSDAVKSRASDIHIEPYEDFVEVRYRIDGYLKNIMKIPVKMHSSLVVRIKILSDLDISETRSPQDGRCSILIHERKVDLRISIIPTFHGEKIVIRLLDKSQEKKYIEQLGMEPGDLSAFKEAIQKPQGMVLVTGPTGSGKTSTLYAALGFIKSETKNIVTIEDPIEYLTEGINQIPVNPAKNVTFASGLKSILRQDPNVILVGEIRDLETAEIAFRASLTGHLVFSTLHTNNAVSTVIRLLDLGLEPYLIGSSLAMIVAQRLVRIICPGCRQEITDAQEVRQMHEKFGIFIQRYKLEKLYKGAGCETCNYTGFLNRTAIFEILKVSEKVKKLISEKASEDEIMKAARESRFRTLAEAGGEKARSGVTTIEEVERVCGIQEIDFDIQPKESYQGTKGSDGEKTSLESSPREVNEVANELRKAVNKRHTVLIVDDEPDIRTILTVCFESCGYNVIEAEDGEEGVKKAYRDKPSLIIMDVMMPKMDGVTATKKIRSHLETASIPIVMLTAKSDKTSEIEGLDAGADDYVNKPFDRDKLLARVRMLLRKK